VFGEIVFVAKNNLRLDFLHVFDAFIVDPALDGFGHAADDQIVAVYFRKLYRKRQPGAVADWVVL